jgi:26S proteasome regulatory subunit N1
MTYSEIQPRRTLRYRLLSASLRPSSSPLADPGTWGHEYVRHIAELGKEYTVREGDTLEQPEGANWTPNSQELTIEDLRGLAKQCARSFLDHNAEPDAIDLLEELEIINEITRLVDEITYGRMSVYDLVCILYVYLSSNL